MGKKGKDETPEPLLCRHCKRCGRWFIATHPKDSQEYCERCRQKELIVHGSDSISNTK